MNEALLSGSLDFASGGVGPMLTIWGRTVKNLKVKGIAALNSMPLYLNTTDAAVKTIKDFTDKDRIALPVVKTSIQAVTLQMACEKAFGKGEGHQLDHLTVSMGHPDAEAAMLGGHSEIDSHFGSPPYQEQELENPKVHRVLDSYDVLGGPHTFNTVWATTKFVTSNPKVTKAFVEALDDAVARIKADPAAAAALWGQNRGQERPRRRGRKDHPRSEERVDHHPEEGPCLSRLHAQHRVSFPRSRRIGATFSSITSMERAGS